MMADLFGCYRSDQGAVDFVDTGEMEQDVEKRRK